MTKMIMRKMFNCGFNLKMILLKFSVAKEIESLKRSRSSMYSFHIYKHEGISEETAKSFALRDTQERANRVLSILRKISNEKRRLKRVR